MRTGIVKVEGVTKRFRKGVAHDTLGELIASGVRFALGRPQPHKRDEEFCALTDVSFEIQPGEAVGMIGPNGAGKSTLLKLLAGILRCDAGRIDTRGRLTALIELNAGFHGDLTGRENIYMNASILGMRRAEIDAKFDAIIDFSGVEEFIDTPVKRYSSGMQARLGFAVAAHVDPDVLLVDEVLSVGDALFRQRCVQRMRELVDAGTILLFVTHNLEQMQSFCSRAIVLNRGGVAYDGETNAAVTQYIAALKRADVPRADLCCDETACITDLRIRTPFGPDTVVADACKPLEFEVAFHLSRPVGRLAVEVDVRREVGALLANFNSIRDEETFDAAKGDGKCTLSMPAISLAGGRYLVQAVLRDAETGKVIADTGHRYSIAIEDHARATGILMLPHTWSYEPVAHASPNAVEEIQAECRQT